MGGMCVVPLSWQLFEWAHVIVCMEQEQVLAVLELMKGKGLNGGEKPIHCWDLPDIGWDPYDEELVKLCEVHFLESLQKYETIQKPEAISKGKYRTPL